MSTADGLGGCAISQLLEDHEQAARMVPHRGDGECPAGVLGPQSLAWSKPPVGFVGTQSHRDLATYAVSAAYDTDDDLDQIGRLLPS
jgi:hypothetical protein